MGGVGGVGEVGRVGGGRGWEEWRFVDVGGGWVGGKGGVMYMWMMDSGQPWVRLSMFLWVLG